MCYSNMKNIESNRKIVGPNYCFNFLVMQLVGPIKSISFCLILTNIYRQNNSIGQKLELKEIRQEIRGHFFSKKRRFTCRKVVFIDHSQFITKLNEIIFYEAVADWRVSFLRLSCGHLSIPINLPLLPHNFGETLTPQDSHPCLTKYQQAKQQATILTNQYYKV